jgi:hypothetical protein
MIRRTAIAFAAILLAACTPSPQQDAPATGPEAVIHALYADAQTHIGDSVLPLESIPMSAELQELVLSAEAAADARNEPFIEGDLALQCQDCVSVSDLEITQRDGPADSNLVGHAIVVARFTLNGNEPREVIYDLIEEAEGWRIDNIMSDGGHDLRAEAQTYLAEPQIDTPPEP